MSDSLAQFLAKTEAMFDLVKAQQAEIARTWMLQFVRYLLPMTPGPGNQEPPDSEYYATGRLRGGWQWSVAEPPMDADRWGGGPYDETMDGADTVDLLSGELYAMALPPRIYLWNDVAYGYLVHEGMGRHHRPRPFVATAAVQQLTFLRNAQQSVMARAA